MTRYIGAAGGDERDQLRVRCQACRRHFRTDLPPGQFAPCPNCTAGSFRVLTLVVTREAKREIPELW